MSQNVITGIFYPEAIKFHGGQMRVRGSYPQGFPAGAIVHSTDGRPNDGAQSASYGVTEGKYAYFVIGRTGKVYQNFLWNIGANTLVQRCTRRWEIS